MEVQVYKEKDGKLNFTASEYPIEDSEVIDLMWWELDILRNSTKEEIDLILFNILTR